MSKIKYVKNIEIEQNFIIPGTNVGMLVMKDGTKYYRQHDICRTNEPWPGECAKRVPIIAADAINRYPDSWLMYARVYYEHSVYIHEADLKDYILERQAWCELGGQGKGASKYWCIEAAALIKKLFGYKVSCNGKHMQLTAPAEITQRFESNKKLRRLWTSYSGIIKGLQAQKDLANYWPELVAMERELSSWRTENEVGDSDEMMEGVEE